MKNDLVVKDNALINASYNLEVTEQRLILLAIIRARETGQGITADSKLEIHAGDYMYRFNVDRHAAYKALKEAASNLFERQFSFKEEHKNTGKVGIVRSRWVSSIKYVDDLAVLEVTFTPAVVPLITKLEKHFTSYQLKQVAQLTSKYAIRLYEILIAWREVGKTPVLDITDFRYKLGLEESEYSAMNNFKSRVLEPAIKQINEYTDINAEYAQHKTGRVITGFEFKFKLKDQKKEPKLLKESGTIDMFPRMTDKQILLFANKLAYDDQFSSREAEVGESYENLERRVIKLLSDPNNILKWYDDLKRLGFK
ncbi:replication initiation protein RepM [Acinetobacter baumannii]